MSRAADPRPVIARIRDGKGLDQAGADLIVRGLVEGWLSDAQAGALAMAIVTRGIGDAGRVALTRAMRDSGQVLRWDLPGPVVDKHSTGGIGDSVSLLLAPIVAACGAYVPMISGRGLGHTGGTLDKLESVPGLRTELAADQFRGLVRQTGCAIVAASADIAPADRRLYALRDETETVASLELITASILSKKLAGGIEALVLDVKSGSGGFQGDDAQAQVLARALVDTANGAGCKCRAFVTDMREPLASAAGNALEMAEVIAALKGENPGRLLDLSLILAGECLDLVGIDKDRALAVLASGQAAEAFAAMIAGQGGPRDLLEAPWRYLPRAPVVQPVFAPDVAAGVVTAIDGAALGRAVVALGGGRLHAQSQIDPSVGLSDILRIGDEVTPDRPLAMVHARSDAEAMAASAAVAAAFSFGAKAQMEPLVRFQVDAA